MSPACAPDGRMVMLAALRATAQATCSAEAAMVVAQLCLSRSLSAGTVPSSSKDELQPWLISQFLDDDSVHQV